MIAQRIRELAGRSVQKTRELRMPFRERAARRERAGPDRGSGLFGDLHHQIDGLGAIDAGADHESRAPGFRKRGGQRLHRFSIGPELAADLAGLDRLRRPRPVVDRYRDEGRSARRLHCDVIGARDRRRHIFRPRRLDAEFDVRPWEFRRALGIEKRIQRHDRARLLARGDDQRRLVTVGVEDITHRIADAGRGMQIDEAGVAARLRIAVGHADDGGFLQAQHVVDVVGPVAEERQFGRPGIAEHLLDAERAQQAEGGVLDGGRGVRGFGRFAGQCRVLTTSLRGAKRRSNPCFPRRWMDCFGGACHRARVRATRWLAMTDYHVAVPFMVGWPCEFAVHNSMPAAVSLALTENSLPSNSGCTPR